ERRLAIDRHPRLPVVEDGAVLVEEDALDRHASPPLALNDDVAKGPVGREGQKLPSPLRRVGEGGSKEYWSPLHFHPTPSPSPSNHAAQTALAAARAWIDRSRMDGFLPESGLSGSQAIRISLKRQARAS